jgi:DNA-binding SARP family transcriptional activator
VSDSSAWLEQAVAHATAPAFSVSVSDLRIRSVNEALCHIAGQAATNLVGAPCITVCSGPEDSCECGTTAGHDCVGCPVLLQLEQGADWVTVGLKTPGGITRARAAVLVGSGEFAVSLLREPEPQSTAAAAPPPIEVRALGRFEVTRSSGEPVHTRRPQALTLLKLLLCNRGVALSEDEIVAAIWAKHPPAHPRDALRVLVHDLRTALEPEIASGRNSQFVLFTDGGYMMPLDAPLSRDCGIFTALVPRIAAAADEGNFEVAERLAAEAIDLYRGDFFAPEPAADWFIDKRRRLKGDWNEIMVTRASLLARRGNLAGAIHDLYTATHQDASNETAQQLLLLLLAIREGRTAAAARFVEVHAEYRRRFGIAPSRETAEVAEHIASGEPLESLLRRCFPLAAMPAETTET